MGITNTIAWILYIAGAALIAASVGLSMGLSVGLLTLGVFVMVAAFIVGAFKGNW